MPRYSADEARAAVAASTNYSETLRRLGLRPAGGNHRVLKAFLAEHGIGTEHFDPDIGRGANFRSRGSRPLDEILVRGSTYSRQALKRRLFAEGLKERRCEHCGQGEYWNGGLMALVLDHINGDAEDHRLENLRILCPNCNATLDTHCGRNNESLPQLACQHCGAVFRARRRGQRYCSSACGSRSSGAGARPDLRRAERPPYDSLIAMLEADGYEATGRRFGVSGNAVRKWRLAYEREAAAASGPDV